MKWDASLDTSKLTGPAKEATDALVGMSDALKAADRLLSSFGSKSKSGFGGDGADKAASSAKAATDAAKRVKEATDAAYMSTRRDAEAKGMSAKQEALLLASRQRRAAESAGADKLELTKLQERESKARKALADDNTAKKTSLNSSALKGLGMAGAVVAVGIGSATAALGAMVSLASKATGIASFADLNQIAIGARATSQLAAIQARTNIGFRSMFRGIDSSPLVRATDLFSRNFTNQTTTGRVMGEVLSRAYASVFAAIERLEPVATGVFQGMVLGGLMVENAWIRLRIAAFPITSAIEKAIGPTNALSIAAGLVSMAFAKVADDIEIVAEGIKGATRLAAALGMIEPAKDDPNRAEKSKRGGGREAPSAPGGKPVKVAGESAASAASAAGERAGAAMGAGVVVGIEASQGSVKLAGEKLAAAAEAGAKARAEIRSPARRFRREVGKQIGEGTALGMEDAAPRVQRAAATALVPDPPIPGKASPVRGPAPGVSGPLVSIGQLVVQGPESLASEVRRILDTEIAHAMESMGLGVRGDHFL